MVKIKTTCQSAFNHLTELIRENYPEIQEVLSSVFEIFVSCIQNKDDSLAKMSIHCFKNIVVQNGSQFQSQQWTLVVSTFENIFRLSQPNELLEYQNSQSQVVHTDKCITQCMVQLLSIEVIKEIGEKYHDSLSPQHTTSMLALLKANYDFTYAFNQNITHRYKLWVDGFMGGKQGMKVLPGLLKQEREALSSYCVMLFNAFTHSPPASDTRSQFFLAFLKYSLFLD